MEESTKQSTSVCLPFAFKERERRDPLWRANWHAVAPEFSWNLRAQYVAHPTLLQYIFKMPLDLGTATIDVL